MSKRTLLVLLSCARGAAGATRTATTCRGRLSAWAPPRKALLPAPRAAEEDDSIAGFGVAVWTTALATRSQYATSLHSPAPRRYPPMLPHGSIPSAFALRAVPQVGNRIRIGMRPQRASRARGRSTLAWRAAVTALVVLLLGAAATWLKSASLPSIRQSGGEDSRRLLPPPVPSSTTASPAPPAPPAPLPVVDAHVAFINALAAHTMQEPCPCAVIVTTLSCSSSDLEAEVLPWISYHTELGFRSFFILWDGADEVARARLAAIQHVQLLRLSPGPGHDAAAALRFAAFHANHWQWRGRPGNYVLMVKQGFAVNEAIRAAKLGKLPFQKYHPHAEALNTSWLFHLDVDEAFVPRMEGAALRVEPVLAAQPADVTSARFLNWEGVPPHSSVVSRLAEVTVFKAHGRHVDGRVWGTFAGELKPMGHPEWPVFLVYGNGKPAARLSTPWLRQWGPHFFRGGSHPLYTAPISGEKGGTQRRRRRRLHGEELDGEEVVYVSSDDDNAAVNGTESPSAWREDESTGAVVLHYPYARYSDLRAKAARSCPFAADAAAGNRTKVDDCFVMGFDADVFMASNAQTGSEEQLRALFASRVSLPRHLVDTHLRTGLLREERAPAATLATHKRDIAWVSQGWLPPTPPPVHGAATQAREGGFMRTEDLHYLAFHM